VRFEVRGPRRAQRPSGGGGGGALRIHRQARHVRDDGAGSLAVGEFDVRQIERELRTKLDDWRTLLKRQTPIARQVLTKLLDECLIFTPRPDRSYEFSGEVHFGKFFAGVSHRRCLAGLLAMRRTKHGSGLAGGGGSWSAHLPGSVSFAACACGMTSGPTSTRHSSLSGARCFVGSRCAGRGGSPDRMAISPAPSRPRFRRAGPADRSTLRRLSRLISNSIANVPSTGDATSAFSTTQLNAPQVLESQMYSAGPIGLTGAGNQNAERPSRCRRCHQQRLRTPRHVTSSAATGAPTQRDGHPGQPSPR
jgi:hypothetical protein